MEILQFLLKFLNLALGCLVRLGCFQLLRKFQAVPGKFQLLRFQTINFNPKQLQFGFKLSNLDFLQFRLRMNHALLHQLDVFLEHQNLAVLSCEALFLLLHPVEFCVEFIQAINAGDEFFPLSV